MLFVAAAFSWAARAHGVERKMEHRGIDLTKECGDTAIVDVFAPESAGKHPVVMVIHGGGWRIGTRSDLEPLARAIRDSGYVTVNISYPLYPDESVAFNMKRQLPVFQCIRRWLDTAATSYGGDPSRVAVAGHSAGGQFAAALALLDGPRRYLAFAAWGGKFDFEGNPWMGERDVPYDPMKLAKKGAPPALIVHGRFDEAIPVAEAKAFHEKLSGAGSTSHLEIVEGGHFVLTPDYVRLTVEHFDRYVK